MHKFIYIIIGLFFFNSSILAQNHHSYLPSDINPLLTAFNSDSIHLYTPNLITAKNQLLVFLPGTGAAPQDYRLFGLKAMEEGYHVIILTYNNEPTIHSLCKDSSNPNCYEDTRLEVIDGIDRTTNVTVDENHSIFGRLKNVLQAVCLEFPFENYDFYIENENLNWNKIAWTGHSQGGGHAALIAQKYFSPRVLCFASPKDYSNYFDGPATWYTNQWVTPTDNIFGFGHIYDGYNKQIQIFDNMSLNQQGSPRIYENNTSPYFNTHQLFTNFDVGIIASHSVMIWDGLVPIIDGANHYDEAWHYLLTNDLTVDLKDVSNKHNSHIYPNPFNKNVQIDMGHTHVTSVEIFDMGGHLVFHQKGYQVNEQISLGFLKRGIYILTLSTNNKIEHFKIVKQ